MIGVDWGTTSFRAFRFARDGTIRDGARRCAALLNVPDSRFADTLREEIGPWLAAGENHVLLSGMIGSRQGWKEAPYFPCPAGAPDIAAALVEIEFDWGQVKLVPGLVRTDEAGVAEVMRGEETQVFGVLAAMGGSGLACLPGTPLEMGAGRGRPDRRLHHPHDRRGVRRAARPHDPGAHDARGACGRRAVRCRRAARRPIPADCCTISSARAAQVLAGRLAETDAAAYLSGILVGHEVRAALGGRRGEVVHVIGAPELTRCMPAQSPRMGGFPERHDGEAAARGLALIGGACVVELNRLAPTRCPLVAILRGVKPDEVVAIGAALERQGIAIVEVPLNSPQPMESIALAGACVRRAAADRCRHGDDRRRR